MDFYCLVTTFQYVRGTDNGQLSEHALVSNLNSFLLYNSLLNNCLMLFFFPGLSILVLRGIILLLILTISREDHFIVLLHYQTIHVKFSNN